MCGIAGYVGPRALPDAHISECLSRMRRRGPDACKALAFERPDGTRVCQLHTRLSIIDLDDRADQPFERDGRWLAFNGELYNYVEIKESLERDGQRFHTSSDTEVLSAVLQTRGTAGLDECEGMWAFAHYNEHDGVLLLCRDRFGEKPLYIFRAGDDLYFGSEVKFIAALLGRDLNINIDQVYRFLVNGYKALYKNGDTFFQGLEELPAGTALRLAPGEPDRLVRYWKPKAQTDEDMSYDEAVRRTRDQLVRSVTVRLRADVPLAFCMSGGVDSNALISIASRVLGYDVHGFTIVNTDARYEEQETVTAAVAELGVRHTAIPIDVRDFLGQLRELVRYHDAPVYTITYYVHWLLMRAVHEHGYRIAVSGTAADELFTGYYDHHLLYLQAVRGDAGLHARSRAAWLEHIAPIVRNPLLQDPDAFVRNPAQREHIFFKAEGFATYLKTQWEEEFSEQCYSTTLLRNRMLNELFHEAVPVILHEDDLNAMYYSIENRSPFLDRGLFELAQQIPTRHLIQDGRAKSVLRDAVRGIAPDAIVNNRRKVGFNAPIRDLLDVGNPAVRQELLNDSPVFEHIDRRRIQALLEQKTLPNSDSKFLFSFVAVKLFLEEHGG
jgi:asparagine synthase (glutamine-hydrolysing)